MRSVLTRGIILSRTNYGEADRIITIMTPDNGKLRLMAKGVRKERSKLAGGIELFSVSQLSFIPGKRDVGTLVSTRLETHYGEIAKDINRTMLGYELLKRFNKATEDAAETEYFDLLTSTLAGLDNQALSIEIIEAWFNAQVIKLAGHSPNLKTDTSGKRLEADGRYGFDPEAMAFVANGTGKYKAPTIKMLRLLFGLGDPEALSQVKDAGAALPSAAQLISLMLSQFIRL